MEQDHNKLMEKQFSKLPSNLQNAINAVPWKILVQEVGKANTLDVEQITSLEQETMFIIYGFEPPGDYISNIVREVGIPEETAEATAESVAEKIFNPILDKAEEKNDSKPNIDVKVGVPEIAPEVHPASVPGETAHNTTPEEKKFMNMESQSTINQEVSEPKNTNRESGTVPQNQDKKPISYPDGKDPYREPIE